MQQLLRTCLLSRRTKLFRPSLKNLLIPTFSRTYASSWDKPPNEVEAHIKVQRLLQDINSHPNVVKSLEVLNKVMIDKKLIDIETGSTPKTWQIVKIMMDKDVRDAMQAFKVELTKSGIKLGPDQLGPLMTVLGIHTK